MTTPLLVNRHAGALRVAHRASARQLGRIAQEVGVDVDMIESRSEAEMLSAVRDYVRRGAPRLAVAGGDGTVASVVQELAHSPTALGIIPTGTANNFAAALRLPTDWSDAMRVIQNGEVVAVDLGRVGKNYFTESAGAGLLADALAFYGLGVNKNLLRALYAAFRLLLGYHSSRLRLYADGELHSERALLCEVMNTARTARALPFAPDATLTDGQLDVVVVGDLKVWELPTYYRAARKQQHHRLPNVHTFRTRELRIAADRALNVHLDERALLKTPVTVTLEPGALRVLVERR